MTKNILTCLALIFALSCKKNDDGEAIRLEKGSIWLSGGLMYCAEQIHLDNGDTLIVGIEKIITFTSGDRVSVRYRETGINEVCPPGIACEIIDIKKIE